MTRRTLIVGDPVVPLGTEALIPDGAVIVEDSTITEVGPRSILEGHGPFDEILGSRDSIVMPGFINCHYHSELAVGPGLYQYIFEMANISIQGGVGPIRQEDLYDIVLLGLVQAIRGGQTATLDMFYGRPSLPHFGTDHRRRGNRRSSTTR